MPTAPTSTRSRKERTGVDRLYKYVGARKVSFYYQYRDGKSETLGSADIGDRPAIALAERIAKRRALEIQEGAVVAGSVAELIEKFRDEAAPRHYRDQSKDGLAVRASGYRNLTKFFGAMAPMSLRTVHGYQFLEARAKAGAPASANKELSLMSTICHYGVRWGLVETNPFVDMMKNQTDSHVRTTSRSQIVRFYLWALQQPPAFRNLGCAAMFTYLTGFRAAEVRPFHVSGLSDDGVRVISAKRKKGEAQVMKVRAWSTRLRVVVARSKQTHRTNRLYLFANSTGKPYSRSGWGAVWVDAMFAWIASFDNAVARELAAKRAWEAKYRAARKEGRKLAEYTGYAITSHPAYFSALDIRPAAITTKLRNRSPDAYDFAAHADPNTTHKHYDRRTEKKASATE
jgi:site-specific recombinase XerD